MYQISLYNNGVKTVIHIPDTSIEVPRIFEMNLENTENQSGIFSFKIYVGNAGYNRIDDLVTIIDILDTRVNKSIYTGRVISSIPSMDSSGMFYKDVTCESELGYFNDSRVGRWELHPGVVPADAPIYAEGNHTIVTALQKLINNHNANVDSYKRFTLGVVEDDSNVYFSTNYESTLDILLNKIIKDNGLLIKVRKENDIRYLDIILDNDSTISKTEISLRKNIKEFKRTPDYGSFCTRLLAIGKDGLTFEDINDSKNYVEDQTAISKFGIITKPFEWQDVTIKEHLLQKATAKLSEILNHSYASVEVSALDLSYINLTPEKFEVGSRYLVTNEVQGFSGVLKIIKISLNLSEPWNSSLTFSNMPVTLTSNSVSIQQQINSNRVEVLNYNDRLIQKVNNVVSQNADDIHTIITQNADSWTLSLNGKLYGLTYSFDENVFSLGSTANGDISLHTNQYSKWIHGSNYSIAKQQGLFINNGGGERPVKSLDYMVVRPAVANGTTVSIILPEDFAGKAINTDFTVLATYGDFDSSVGTRLNKDAVRTIFVETVSWNGTTRELIVRPCLQKINLVTQTLYGWDSNTTTSGNTIGQGAIDVVVIARI